KSHHADEQFLARRRLKELPADIARLERRIAGLTADMATAAAYRPTSPVTIGSMPYAREEAVEALGKRLERLPERVQEHHSVPLGVYRGLTFGLTLHPHGSPDVYVAGALTRFHPLSRDSQGPRAILNAAERIITAYARNHDKATRDVEIAQGQLRDFEAR